MRRALRERTLSPTLLYIHVCCRFPGQGDLPRRGKGGCALPDPLAPPGGILPLPSSSISSTALI